MIVPVLRSVFPAAAAQGARFTMAALLQSGSTLDRITEAERAL